MSIRKGNLYKTFISLSKVNKFVKLSGKCAKLKKLKIEESSLADIPITIEIPALTKRFAKLQYMEII
jgi:hypothetical protein